MVIPSRHLGLVQAGDVSGVESTIDRAADIVESYLDLDAILSIARAAPAIRTKSQPAARQGADRVRIGVARDAAFTFYYEANLDLLRRNGAEITSFSPLEDHALPENLAGLYIGGGYPEIHAHALAGNTSMREAMRAAANAGMPIYAECGGMLYLGRRLTDLEGQDHDMVGALSIDGVMESRRMALGYAETTALRDSPILARGWTARGHEFHWSRIVAPAGSCKPAYRVVTSSGSRDEGFVIGSIVASYVHLHFASQPQLVPRWLDACRSWRKMSMIPAHR
jgi:cobyrinic acid a,c-diamide synthase